jgi:hypothetical protein
MNEKEKRKLTLKDLEEIIAESLGIIIKEVKERCTTSGALGGEDRLPLEEKCLSGYWYGIVGRGGFTTGCGGAKDLIREMRKQGMADLHIADSIGVWVKNQFIPLSALTVVPKDQANI